MGIPIVGGKSWFAGVTIVEQLVKSLASLAEAERPQTYLIVSDQTLRSYPEHAGFVGCFSGVIFIGNDRQLALQSISVPIQFMDSIEQLFSFIDFMFPVSMGVISGHCAASWIHDFQHKRLPHFFPPQVIAQRDEVLRKIADIAKLVIVTSRDVKDDFFTYYPDSTAKVRVLNYRLRQEPEWVAADPVAVQKKYQLPDSFLLCSNQFWMHKNQKCLFEALAVLRQQGVKLHLVCTGHTGDFRNPQFFAKLMEYVKYLGIEKEVHVLGIIPRMDQIQLLRRSLFVVQPSLFEGLGLIIQECASLGKHIVLSDLDVHKEQASEYTHFFSSNDPTALARQIEFLSRAGFQPGPHLGEEHRARGLAEKNVVLFGKQFIEIVQYALVLYQKALSV